MFHGAGNQGGVPFPLRPRAMPVMAWLFDSVPPEVKKTSCRPAAQQPGHLPPRFFHRFSGANAVPMGTGRVAEVRLQKRPHGCDHFRIVGRGAVVSPGRWVEPLKISLCSRQFDLTTDRTERPPIPRRTRVARLASRHPARATVAESDRKTAIDHSGWGDPPSAHGPAVQFGGRAATDRHHSAGRRESDVPIWDS
jgi:hypothetical protein